jgi:hypothetical protein
MAILTSISSLVSIKDWSFQLQTRQDPSFTSARLRTQPIRDGTSDPLAIILIGLRPSNRIINGVFRMIKLSGLKPKSFSATTNTVIESCGVSLLINDFTENAFKYSLLLNYIEFVIPMKCNPQKCLVALESFHRGLSPA